MRICAAALAAACIVLPGLALAQGATDAAPMEAGTFAASVGTVVEVLVGAAAMTIAGAVVAFVRARFGDDAANRIKDALDRAIAAGSQEVGRTTVDLTGAAVGYVKRQLPKDTRRVGEAKVRGLVAAEVARRSTTNGGTT